MTRKKRAASVVATLALVMSVVPLVALPAAAASAPEVVATGLNAPYKLTQGPDGAIYVAESGTGGDTCNSVVGPDGAEVDACVGSTGSVTKITASGQSRVASGLPSVALGFEMLGPTGIGFDASNRMHVTVGLGGNVDSRALLGNEMFGTLLRIPASGDPVVVSDITAFEQANDPVVGSHGPDSNPFSLAFDGNDALVVDAGANALFRVKPDGTTTTEATFPVQFVDPPAFLGIPGPMPMEAVPTGITITDGGRTLIGNLTGFPFMPGHARVVAVVGGNLVVEETGFTNIIDIASAPDGSLYVLEFAANSLLSPDGPQAALTQVRPDGTRKVLLYGDDLPVPGGVTVADDGMVYVSACTLCGPGQGMVWKIDPSVAADAATADACDPASVPGSGFTDTKTSTHREAIDCAAWWGVMNGFNATTFGPASSLTREQAASVILRTITAADVAIIQGAPDAFGDDDGSPHEADINVLAAMGVIQGVGDGNFNPKGNVSRAELASLMARAYEVVAGEALAAGTNAFTDDDGSGHEAAINAVAAAGWVNGIGGGLFDPSGNATRAQIASVIARMLSTMVAEGLATTPGS